MNDQTWINDQMWWYLARGSGIVAMVLLVLSLIWGILLATRALEPHDRPAWLLDLHRRLGALALVMTALHLLGLAADGYVSFGARELFVPGASSYRPVAVAFGVLAMYLVVAVEATSLLRRRLPAAVWRSVHLVSYGALWAAAVHAGLAGTDTTNRLYQAVALVLTIAVTAAVIVRVLAPGRARRRSRTVRTRGDQSSPRREDASATR